jgi:hypothetical protein
MRTGLHVLILTLLKKSPDGVAAVPPQPKKGVFLLFGRAGCHPGRSESDFFSRV